MSSSALARARAPSASRRAVSLLERIDSIRATASSRFLRAWVTCSWASRQTCSACWKSMETFSISAVRERIRSSCAEFCLSAKAISPLARSIAAPNSSARCVCMLARSPHRTSSACAATTSRSASLQARSASSSFVRCPRTPCSQVVSASWALSKSALVLAWLLESSSIRSKS